MKKRRTSCELMILREYARDKITADEKQWLIKHCHGTLEMLSVHIDALYAIRKLQGKIAYTEHLLSTEVENRVCAPPYPDCNDERSQFWQDFDASRLPGSEVPL